MMVDLIQLTNYCWLHIARKSLKYLETWWSTVRDWILLIDPGFTESTWG